jgi:hypothetical protein
MEYVDVVRKKVQTATLGSLTQTACIIMQSVAMHLHMPQRFQHFSLPIKGALLGTCPFLTGAAAAEDSKNAGGSTCSNFTSSKQLKVWQPRRAARSKRPNTPSDGTKTNGPKTHPKAEALPTTITRETSTAVAVAHYTQSAQRNFRNRRLHGCGNCYPMLSGKNAGSSRRCRSCCATAGSTRGHVWSEQHQCSNACRPIVFIAATFIVTWHTSRSITGFQQCHTAQQGSFKEDK